MHGVETETPLHESEGLEENVVGGDQDLVGFDEPPPLVGCDGVALLVSVEHRDQARRVDEDAQSAKASAR